MAKRTKLTAPSADELAAMDDAFRSESLPRPGVGTAPIAQVAAETAQASSGVSAQQTLDRLDAKELRDAKDAGLLIVEIPTAQISTDDMIRDRTILIEDEMTELQMSIRANGLRLPIEVYAGEEGTYHLLSGYRRLLAVRALEELNPTKGYDKIKALVRAPADTADSFAAMIEENEIRANLSHFERGRIAVIAAKQGAFPSTNKAISGMFSFASAAKRSKIKSFAEVFEELGDLLNYPEKLSERRGLRLANALRQNGAAALRDALATVDCTSPDLEWAVLESAIEGIEAGPVKLSKMGRPKAPMPVGWEGHDTVHLSSGISLRKGRDADGYIIHFSGKGINASLVDLAMRNLQHLLEKP